MKNTKRSPKCRNPLGIPLLFLSILLAFSADAQNPSVRVFEDWNTVSGTQNDFQRCVTRSKSIGGAVYYYLCGSTLNSSGNYDLLVQKKNSSGTVLWSQTYNGAGNGNDYATDVQISSGGSVYVCGTYYKNSTDSNNAIIIKYNNSGTQQWAYTYNGTGSRHDAFAAMQLSTNTLVAVGSTWKDTTNKYDFLMTRVDTNGNSVWTQNWNYNNLNDGSVNLWNKGTTIYVAGGAQAATTTYKYAVVSVKLSDGSILGSQVTGGNAFGIDQVTDIQTDGSNYLYVTGGVLNANTLYDWKTIKLDTALNILWSASYDGGDSLIDIATGLTVDQVGNVIVTGYKTDATSGKDYVTIKYSSGGTQRWVSTFDGGINQSDSASCIVVSKTDTNKIYVGGYSYNGSSQDYWTMKYDGLGNQKWNIGFNNIYNTDDRATAIAFDTLGNIIVAGQNKLNDSTHTYTTVKYVEKNVTMPDDTISYTSNSFIYTENRGQIWGSDSATHPEIRYYVLKGGPQTYFMDTAVSFVFAKLDTAATQNDTVYRVDMKFKNSNSDQRIHAMEVREDYFNFFLGHIPEGRSRVQNYDKLASFNVWNNVDIIYGSNLMGMKQYFICKPGGGGNPASQIDLYFHGADSVKVDANGQLIVYSPLGNIVYPKAAAWEVDANGNFSSLGWQPSYNIVGTNEVKFTNFGSYNTANTLVIAMDWGNVQPQFNINNLEWSTYLGGGYHDQIHSMDVTSTDRLIVCGASLSTNYPVTPGVVDGSNAVVGCEKAVIAAFKPNDVMAWATYYGGSLDANNGIYPTTKALAVQVATNGIYFTGQTNAKNFPLQPWGSAYYQNTLNGSLSYTGRDAYIAQISLDGQTKIWSTYYGGSGDDFAWDIKVGGGSGEIYFGGYSSANFPLPGTPPSWSTGTGFIVHLDVAGVPLFGSNIGSSGGGIVEGIYVAYNGDVVITGSVPSGTGFPISQPGSGNTGNSTYAGGLNDAFITMLSGSNNSTIVWSTYFGGTGDEQAHAITYSPFTNIYFIAGNTSSVYSAGLPPMQNPGGGAFFQGSRSGPIDGFVVAIDQNGNIPWATYYGGPGVDGAYGVALDQNGNLYLTGQTYSSSLPTANPNLSGGYVDGSLSGTTDTYIEGFAANTYAPFWTTYLGGGFNDAGYAIGCYGNTSLYVGGYGASHSTFPFCDGGPNCTTQGVPYYDNAVGANEYKSFITELCLSTVLTVHESESAMTNLSIYPNPTSSSITIKGNVDTQEEVIIQIFDVLGQVVYEQILPPTPMLNQEINLVTLSSGIYVVQVTSGNQSTTQKVVLEK